MKSTFTSVDGPYYEGGYKYYYSAGTYERREDGKCFKHYVANMGNLYHEISEDEYTAAVAALRLLDGTVSNNYARAKLTLTEDVREVDVYSWELNKSA